MCEASILRLIDTDQYGSAPSAITIVYAAGVNFNETFVIAVGYYPPREVAAPAFRPAKWTRTAGENWT